MTTISTLDPAVETARKPNPANHRSPDHELRNRWRTPSELRRWKTSQVRSYGAARSQPILDVLKHLAVALS